VGQTTEITWSTGTAKLTINEAKWIDNANDASQVGASWPPQNGVVLALNVSYDVTSGSVSHSIDNWIATYDDPTTAGPDFLYAFSAAGSDKGFPDCATFKSGEKHTGFLLFDMERRTVDVWVYELRKQLVTWSIPG
jgi:hypothetical protein